MPSVAQKVYEVIVRRFLAIFYPPAEYKKINIVTGIDTESFFASFKVLVKSGYLEMASASFSKNNIAKANTDKPASETSKPEGADDESENAEAVMADISVVDALKNLKKGTVIDLKGLNIKEGETSPPKRYNSGSLILAMENAGQLIEDEELRAQIKSCGIGTSATRAEILSKLVKIGYLNLNKKTQIITPKFLGEIIYEVVESSISSLLNPELTASWEKGLTLVADGKITEKEYMDKLAGYVVRRVDVVKNVNNSAQLGQRFNRVAVAYKSAK